MTLIVAQKSYRIDYEYGRVALLTAFAVLLAWIASGVGRQRRPHFGQMLDLAKLADDVVAHGRRHTRRKAAFDRFVTQKSACVVACEFVESVSSHSVTTAHFKTEYGSRSDAMSALSRPEVVQLLSC